MENSISVVVITYNEENTISNLLGDLAVQTHQDFEVILVDSNSEDQTIAVAQNASQQLREFSIIEMSDRGASLGRNTGALAAKYERLLFLDSDVRIRPNFLKQSLEKLQQSGLKVAGGRMQSTVADWKVRLAVATFDYAMVLGKLGFPTAVGACIFSTRTVHRDINGFDTRIKLCEDCDYVKRASRSYRFAMLNVHFEFDVRRLTQDGLLRTGWVYLKANCHRLLKGELTNDQIPYTFGHYKQQSHH